MDNSEIEKKIKRLQAALEHVSDFQERLDLEDEILELKDKIGTSIRACGLDGDCENCGS